MKQKFFMRLAAVAAVLLLSAASAMAHDFEVDGIYYNINSDGTSVSVTYKGNSSDAYANEYSGAITIPASVTYSGKTYSVTSIGGSAFYGCSGLTSVSIGNSVTAIGERAFFSCSGLTSVEIPNSVTSIGDYAFYGCSGLTSVSIGNSVTGISEGAFYGCSGITSVVIPNSVTSIGNYAFFGCDRLKKVEISDLEAWCKISFSNATANPIYYSHNLFLNGQEIKNLIIPETIQELKSRVFYGCSGLTSVVIPNSVTRIKGSAFAYCSGLTSVEIPNSVISIDNSAFSGCSGLKSVVIPNSVTSIGYGAFSDCSGLTSVEIPNSVTSIGISAFSGCSGLTSVVIPNSVTRIKGSAFAYCSGLTSVEIPNSVISIDNSAFSGCSGLKSVVIPNSVTSIGYGAFSDCSGLTSVEIPNSVTSIGYEAFYKCYDLNIVLYNATNSTSGGHVFDKSCTFVIGENVTNLPDKLFMYSCRIVSHAAEPPVITGNTFSSSSTLYVSPDAYLDYWMDENWGKMTLVEIANLITSIDLNLEEYSIAPNGSIQLAATITPTNATLKNIYWCSDNQKVASVDQNGLVKGLSEGEATITATAIDGSGVVATCHITVGEAVNMSLELDPSEITIERNKTAVIKPVFLPAGTSIRPCEWSCSDESVVKYKANSDGSITIIGVITDGEAIITCHTTDGSDLTATCTVTVGNGPATDVTCKAVQDDVNPADYYATFSNNATDVELHPAAGATLTVYNVTVSGNTLVLTPRDANTVARGEAVLVKTSYNTFTASPLSGSSLTPAEYGTTTLLLATPSEAQTVSCQASEAKLYRLTYYDIDAKTGLGFYWGNADGTQINAKPGKGYLKVPTSQTAEIKGFRINLLPTHVDGIDAEVQGSDEPIYDLSGRRVENPTSGIYLQNNKKIIVK
ncbi:MAG: leucine-rich repeat protein [Muribaculaceae bacterium]